MEWLPGLGCSTFHEVCTVRFPVNGGSRASFIPITSVALHFQYHCPLSRRLGRRVIPRGGKVVNRRFNITIIISLSLFFV